MNHQQQTVEQWDDKLPLDVVAADIVAEKIDVSSPKETEDEGMDSASETTPEAASLNSSQCDSGFASSIENLDLQCLECVLEFPKCNRHRTHDGGGLCCTCTCSAIQEHHGFEEYVDEIFLHRLSIEHKYHALSCLDNQPDVSPDVRAGVVQWLTRVHHRLQLAQDTLFLAVNIIDRVLNVMVVARDCLELLGITALLVAAKQNEVCVPEISDLLTKCKDKFTRDQVRQLELIILMATSFDLIPPTTDQFLEYFASFCLAKYRDEEQHSYKLKMARAVGRCVLELALQEYELCQHPPSLLALCVWRASVKYVHATDGNFYLSALSGQFSQNQYESCLSEVNSFMDKFPKDIAAHLFV